MRSPRPTEVGKRWGARPKKLDLQPLTRSPEKKKSPDSREHGSRPAVLRPSLPPDRSMSPAHVPPCDSPSTACLPPAPHGARRRALNE